MKKIYYPFKGLPKIKKNKEKTWKFMISEIWKCLLLIPIASLVALLLIIISWGGVILMIWLILVSIRALI